MTLETVPQTIYVLRTTTHPDIIVTTRREMRNIRAELKKNNIVPTVLRSIVGPTAVDRVS